MENIWKKGLALRDTVSIIFQKHFYTMSAVCMVFGVKNMFSFLYSKTIFWEPWWGCSSPWNSLYQLFAWLTPKHLAHTHILWLLHILPVKKPKMQEELVASSTFKYLSVFMICQGLGNDHMNHIKIVEPYEIAFYRSKGNIIFWEKEKLYSTKTCPVTINCFPKWCFPKY